MKQSIRGKYLLLPLMLGTLVAAGCGGDDDDNGGGDTVAAPGNGNSGDGDQQAASTLNLTVNGLADGAASDVQAVPADGGDPVDLTAGNNDVPAGDYTIAVNPARADADNVDQLFAGRNDSDTVSVSEDTATDVAVTYDDEPRGGSGRLWVANPTAGDAQGFDQTALTDGATAPADAIIGGIGIPDVTAFDGAGNLWVGDLQSNSLLMYTPQDLADAAAGSAPASASVTLSGDGTGGATQITNPGGLAFDSQGNLWVSNFGQDSLIGYTPDQLAAGGSPTPAFLIEGTDADGPTLNDPNGLAFNADGFLWVANRAQVGDTFTLAAYGPDQLAAATSGGGATQPAPVAVIDDSGGSGDLDTPIGLAFDADGDLWASNRGRTNNLVEFSQADLAVGGDVNANTTVTIADGATGASELAGIGFDNEGDLWVVDTGNDRLVEALASDLTDGGSVTPDTSIAGFVALGNTVNVSFNPPPAELPLNAVGAGGVAGDGNDDDGADDTGADNTGTDDTGADNTGTDDTGADNPGTDDDGANDTGTDDTGTDDTGTDDTGDGAEDTTDGGGENTTGGSGEDTTGGAEDTTGDGSADTTGGGAEDTTGAENTTDGAEDTTGGAEDTTDGGADDTTGGGGADTTDGGAEDTTDGAEDTTGGAEDTTDGGTDDTTGGGGADTTDGGAEDTTGGAEDTTDGGTDDTTGGGGPDTTDGGAEDTTGGAEDTTGGAEDTTEGGSDDTTGGGGADTTDGGAEDTTGGAEETTDGGTDDTTGGGGADTTDGGAEDTTGGAEDTTGDGSADPTGGGAEDTTGGDEETTDGGAEDTTGGAEETTDGGTDDTTGGGGEDTTGSGS